MKSFSGREGSVLALLAQVPDLSTVDTKDILSGLDGTALKIGKLLATRKTSRGAKRQRKTIVRHKTPPGARHAPEEVVTIRVDPTAAAIGFKDWAEGLKGLSGGRGVVQTVQPSARISHK